jgi:hypothetical protein
VKPEVLVWALLFVFAFGLILRAFSQAARRAKRSGDEPAPFLNTHPAAQAGHATSAIEPAEPMRFAPAAPKPVAPASTQHHEQFAVSPQTSEAPARTVPSFIVASTPAVIVHEPTVIAAPDIKATMDPAAVVKPRAAVPNVKATLPPSPVATPGVDFAVPNVKATLPRDATSPALTIIPDVKATLAPTSAVTSKASIAATDIEELPPPAASTDAISEQSPETPLPILLNGTVLRARRLGHGMPPLDERLKETRSRKLRPRSKMRRKPVRSRQLSRKTPQLRIIAAPKVSNTFVSARAQTKIVDVPPKEPRVRFAHPENTH